MHPGLAIRGLINFSVPGGQKTLMIDRNTMHPNYHMTQPWKHGLLSCTLVWEKGLINFSVFRDLSSLVIDRKTMHPNFPSEITLKGGIKTMHPGFGGSQP